MSDYKPNYDTKIETVTTIERQNTMHLTWIDWDNYPFENDTSEPDAVEKKKEYLRICEQCKAKEIRASKYNMYSQKVYGVCMASCWPYWKPRPTVLLKSALGGMEWVDWTEIAWAREADIGTGVDIMHGLCKQCEKWGDEIAADCEQRKQELIVAKIKAAMTILEQSPCGAVGKYGLNRDQLEVQPDDTNHYATQSAWLELNELLETIT